MKENLMTWFKRIGYVLLTAMLVSLTLSFVINLMAHFFGADIFSGGYAGLFILCLVIGIGGSFISLQLSRWMAKKFHGVKVIDPQTTNMTERKLLDTVYRIARSAGMDVMPEVGYYESADINAFATGPSKSRSLVAVSTGLMHGMSEGEIEGVLAHEIAHIVNGDMVTLTLIQGIINTFAMFFAHLITMAIMNVLRKGDDEERSGFGDFMLRQVIYQVVSIVFMFLGAIVVNYFSRAREFRADAGGARFASQEKMTAALMKLQKVYALPSHQKPEDKANDGLATMKISGKAGGLSRLFMTHPPLEERIAALRNRTYAPSI